MTITLFPGTEVLARGLRWEVVDTAPAGLQTRCRLRCLAEPLRGHEIDLLTPLETIEPVSRELEPEKAANLAQWRLYHQAFLLEQALGPGALLAAKPGRLQPAPYQLVPLMRVLHMSRPRLLIADAVGLGKTIEAGLILAELIARRRAHRILIVTPAGPLMRQWDGEMRERFGLRFTAIDRDRLTQIRFEQELGANPFDHVALGLISIDFAKQESVLQHLERTQYDVVVIDEAHHCVSLDSDEREDSQRRQLAEVLARRSDGLILLTATPHDGYDPHFASLIELLDPSLVDGRGSLRGDRYSQHVIRRLKRHIKKVGTDEPLFREREVFPVPVRFDDKVAPGFTAFQRALVALIAPQLKRAVRARQFGDVLAFVALLKRSVSTVAAARSTLDVVAERLDTLAQSKGEKDESRRQRIRTLTEYHKRIDRFGGLSAEEEEDLASLEAEDMAAELAKHNPEELIAQLAELRRDSKRERRKLRDVKSTRDALRALGELAEEALGEDPKLVAVLDKIQAIRRSEPHANVLVYTEYADSQAALVECLAKACKKGSLTGAVLQVSGSDGEKDRIAIVERFKEEDDLVLVSTDATSEGLDLHLRCHHLIHLELPYNPNRLEQRNGRIDRFGQAHNPQVHYLFLAGTFEERLLLRLIEKYERQRARLTFVPNTLGNIAGDLTSTRLLEGLAADDGMQLFRSSQEIRFDVRADADDPESSAYKDLLAEVEKAFAGFKKAAKTNAWLGDDGLHASTMDVGEAESANAAGARVGIVDIVEFVVDALRAEAGSSAVKQPKDGTLELKLPGNWKHGLEEMPGFDADSVILRLTTRIDQMVDSQNRAVGYLGRAHPIVRRALDRVRNQLHGSAKDALDRRVSAATGDSDQPEALYTFVGRLTSGAGRELERVFAVRVARDGTVNTYAEHADWAQLTDPSRAIATQGIWKKQFASWLPKHREIAERKAREAFAAACRDYADGLSAELEAERLNIDSWLRQRSRQICGEPRRAVQGLLFERTETEAEAPWARLDDGLERLTTFALDRRAPIQLRSEAETVVRLYRHRIELVARRRDVSPQIVAPLGLLLLVPNTKN
jgi:ERCC4-related helicase